MKTVEKYFQEENPRKIIDKVRRGIPYKQFREFAKTASFSFDEWARFLHLSKKTFERYESENKSFDQLHSEKIFEIAQLIKKGFQVFENHEHFFHWLEIENLPLGKIRPKELLDSSFGIELVKQELGRIEHGILA